MHHYMISNYFTHYIKILYIIFDINKNNMPCFLLYKFSFKKDILNVLVRKL